MNVSFASMAFLLAHQLCGQAFQAPQLQSRQLFDKNCSGCHGSEAQGSAKGPALAMNQRVAQQSAEQLGAYLERGNIAAGMPSF